MNKTIVVIIFCLAAMALSFLALKSSEPVTVVCFIISAFACIKVASAVHHWGKKK